MSLSRFILDRCINLVSNCPRTFCGPLRLSSAIATPHSSHQQRRLVSQSLKSQDDESTAKALDTEGEDSALTRRFAEMAEEAITSSPRNAAKIAAENAFSEGLKRELGERIAKAEFNSTHAQVLSAVNLPPGAPKQTRDIAAATPWTGTESMEDAVLRMLVDAHKPLRGDLARGPKPHGPANIDIRPSRPSQPQSASQRIARAREKTTEYTINKSEVLSDSERSEVRHMFRERFMPEGRAVASLSALASLADEKIEEARARGQFRNLPRGKPLERDHNADSPFLDTTEYFMNRIIQKQNIVPPWIERQQDLARAASEFRERLRVDWKRHVARAISSAGGSLDEQCRRAGEYAAGEVRLARKEERARKIEREEKEESISGEVVDGSAVVFRDATWEERESQYHKLAIENLNSTTRSYNLMAPELAKKPYFNLEREMKACFRDTAPMIVREIRERAKIPTHTAAGSRRSGSGAGALFGKLGGEEKVVVHESTEPYYGFKELFKDAFSGWKWGRRAT